MPEPITSVCLVIAPTAGSAPTYSDTFYPLADTCASMLAFVANAETLGLLEDRELLHSDYAVADLLTDGDDIVDGRVIPTEAAYNELLAHLADGADLKTPKPRTAKLITDLREAADLSWHQVSLLLGTSRTTVLGWAAGRRMGTANTAALTTVYETVVALPGSTPHAKRTALLAPHESEMSTFDSIRASRASGSQINPSQFATIEEAA